MCGMSSSSAELAIIRQARRAADELVVTLLREPITKAMDLGDPEGFDRAITSLAAELRQRASTSERDAVRAAVGVLDVDWKKTTAAQRRKLVSEAMNAAGRATAVIPARIKTSLGSAADEVVSATRSHGRRVHGLAIGADFNQVDQRITRHVVSTQVNYVTSELGRRLDDFSAQARRVVAEGLEVGLGRDDISRALQLAAENALVSRSKLYWNVVAGAFIGNARSFSQLSSFAEAGITRYQIEAVLDEQTSECCRFLHGKVFSVSDGLRRFEALERLDKPEDVKDAQPWVREGVEQTTGRRALFVERGGVRTPLAEIVRSGVGSVDDQGQHRQALSSHELMDLGVSFPPFHASCRSTLVPLL